MALDAQTASALAGIYSSTVVGASFILALAGIGSALGWGLICAKYLEGVSRQPELRAQLMGQMLFSGGLMEAFPMIVLGLSMWFVTANPFVSAFLTNLK